MTDTSALENLKYAHAIDVSLDLSSQEVHELWAEIETRDKRVAELEAAQRWIPVSERLPEENVTVLVVTKRNRNPVVAWMRLGFWRSRGVDFALSVTHWMPLPQPPEVQE